MNLHCCCNQRDKIFIGYFTVAFAFGPVYTNCLIIFSAKSCHSLLDELVSCSVVSNSCKPTDWGPTRLLCPRNFPCKNTGVDSLSLLQAIFPTL